MLYKYFVFSVKWYFPGEMFHDLLHLCCFYFFAFTVYNSLSDRSLEDRSLECRVCHSYHVPLMWMTQSLNYVRHKFCVVHTTLWVFCYENTFTRVCFPSSSRSLELRDKSNPGSELTQSICITFVQRRYNICTTVFAGMIFYLITNTKHNSIMFRIDHIYKKNVKLFWALRWCVAHYATDHRSAYVIFVYIW